MKDDEYKQASEIYKKKVSNITKLNISTNKWLYNYQYVGIIAKQIPNAKIIHCFRNPLDNILSIYRTHFSAGNQYSTSLVDCAKVYLDQEIMAKLGSKSYLIFQELTLPTLHLILRLLHQVKFLLVQ
mgnify:CR=1 FL=1